MNELKRAIHNLILKHGFTHVSEAVQSFENQEEFVIECAGGNVRIVASSREEAKWIAERDGAKVIE